MTVVARVPTEQVLQQDVERHRRREGAARRRRATENHHAGYLLRMPRLPDQ